MEEPLYDPCTAFVSSNYAPVATTARVSRRADVVVGGTLGYGARRTAFKLRNSRNVYNENEERSRSICNPKPRATIVLSDCKAVAFLKVLSAVLSGVVLVALLLACC